MGSNSSSRTSSVWFGQREVAEVRDPFLALLGTLLLLEVEHVLVLLEILRPVKNKWGRGVMSQRGCVLPLNA